MKITKTYKIPNGELCTVCELLTVSYPIEPDVGIGGDCPTYTCSHFKVKLRTTGLFGGSPIKCDKCKG